MLISHHQCQLDLAEATSKFLSHSLPTFVIQSIQLNLLYTLKFQLLHFCSWVSFLASFSFLVLPGSCFSFSSFIRATIFTTSSSWPRSEGNLTRSDASSCPDSSWYLGEATSFNMEGLVVPFWQPDNTNKSGFDQPSQAVSVLVLLSPAHALFLQDGFAFNDGLLQVLKLLAIRSRQMFQWSSYYLLTKDTIWKSHIYSIWSTSFSRLLHPLSKLHISVVVSKPSCWSSCWSFHSISQWFHRCCPWFLQGSSQHFPSWSPSCCPSLRRPSCLPRGP